MYRRSFLKTGSLVITGLATGNLGFSFVPDDFYESEEFDNAIPFRKPPRKIREVATGFLWIDAADFSTYGGWALDTQHVGFMGSSYLIAHGTGTPVVDPRGCSSSLGGRIYRRSSRAWESASERSATSMAEVPG